MVAIKKYSLLSIVYCLSIRLIIFLFVAKWLFICSFAQQKTDFPSMQDSVLFLFNKMISGKTESIRQNYSDQFKLAMISTLNTDNSFHFAFDSLKKYKVIIESPDKELRIFTWNVEGDDGTQKFFGFVQAYNKKLKKYEVHTLTDKSDGIKDPQNAAVDNTKWFGAYYYQIITKKIKKKKYYFLFGWDGNNRVTNKKLIDVLYFNEKGFPKFGESLFKMENGKILKRFILEYKAGVFVSLRYDENKNIIVFDHLSPSNSNLEGQYQFYGPDFTYDGFEFKNEKWQYIKNVDVRNLKNKTNKYYISPK
ncbi:MAG: hypothetical protein V1781_03960 [Bacteroidota bacterium]